MADFLSSIPFLKDVDFDDPKTKRNIFVALAIGVLTVLLIVLSVAKNDGKAPTAEEQDTNRTSIETPLGEDNDVLGMSSAQDVWDRRKRTDNSLSNIYENSIIDENDPMATLKGTKKGTGEPGSSDAFDVRSSIEDLLNPQDEQPGESSFGKDVYPERPQRTPKPEQQTPSRQERAVPTPAPRQAGSYGGKAMTPEERVEARRRAILTERGYDPDTMLPIEESHPVSGSSSASTSSASASAPAEEQHTEERAQPESKVSVRKSGEISSLRASHRGTVGGLGSLRTKDQYVSEDSEHLFKVMFANSEKITSGQRVTLRLLDDMVVDGVLVPANTFISAICTVGDRLSVTVNSIELNGRIYTLNYEGYDTDGAKGLYCPHTDKTQTKEEVGREGRNVGRTLLSNRITGMAGTVVSAGASIVESSKGQVKITVTSGYTFFLKKAKNN